MYEDYLIALKKVNKYIKHLQEENRKIKKSGKELTKEQRFHRNTIYETKKDIIATLIEIEKYLPVEKRIYYNKYKKEDKKYWLEDNIIKIKNALLLFNKKNIASREDDLIKKEQLNELLDLFNKELSPQQYNVIKMFYIDGLSRKEIMDELNINKRTLSDHILKAYKKIMKSSKIVNFLKKTDE